MKRYLSAIFIIFLSINLNAQFIQQGPKLVGTGAVGLAEQGCSVSISSDGNTAIVGGYGDNNYQGAVWVFIRQNGQWVQQGEKLVGTGAVGEARQGFSVSISGDGNTAIVGGFYDNFGRGAAWIFTRINGVWTQQGSKLVGTGVVDFAYQGRSVAISSDGNTAAVGGWGDDNHQGAVWIFTRQNGVWTQQGSKLVGTGVVGYAYQGTSLSLSSDGNTIVVGGYTDNNHQGAAWIFTRQNGIWTQQGEKLVGTGAVEEAFQGCSVSISADGNTAIMGGFNANGGKGAAWVFIRQNGIWTQQGEKLVGTGAVGAGTWQGYSVGISSDGNTAAIGGIVDNGSQGATWIFTRQNGLWIQQGSKLVGTGATGNVHQGASLSLSSDGSTIIVGSSSLNDERVLLGAAWIFARPVTYTISATAGEGGSISPSGIVNVKNGENKSFAVTPDKGYHTAEIKADGQPVADSITSYTFINVTKNHSIEVSFAHNIIPDLPVPMLAYPAGGVLVYSNSPILNWYINKYYPGAKYHLQLSESADFKSIFFEKDNIDGFQLEVSGLKGGNTYYSRVRLKTLAGEYGEYSPVESFKVNSQGETEPVIPTLAYPTGGATVYSSSPELNWYLNQWAPPLKYQLQLSLSHDFTNPVFDASDIDGLSYKVQGLSGGVTYYSRVRSFTSDGNYSEYSATGSFTVNYESGTLAVTPTLAYPTGGVTVYTTSPLLNWYIGGYAPDQKYQLQVSTKPDFSSFVLNQDDITSNQYQLNGLSNGVTYYTKIRGKASNGTYSLYSSTGSFTVYAGDNNPVMPVAASPSKGIMVQYGSAVLSWYSPTNTAAEQKYDLQVSTKQDFSDLTQVTDIDSSSFIIRDLKDGTKYFWRVRSKTVDGKTSEYSNEGNFFTSKLTNIALQRDNLIPREYELLQNYPNPFNPSTTISYSIPKQSYVELKVYDIIGIEIETLVSKEQNAGEYLIQFDGSSLPSGMYIYSIQAGEFRASKKLLLIK